MKRLDKKAKGGFKWGIVVGTILVFLAVALFYINKNRIFAFLPNKDQARQAIFLTNGQVYFGKIEREDDRYLVLREIYYLKTQDQLSPNNPDKRVSIIKLGEEAHRPEDKMYISRSQILFYEQMKKDSKINEAIDRYMAEKK